MFKAKGLMVFYENMLALNNVSLSCDKNQIIGVFGANSAGKSTLMYTLSGIMKDIQRKEDQAGGERITIRGNLEFEGRDIVNDKPSRRAKAGIILCPERRRPFREMTVLENLVVQSPTRGFVDLFLGSILGREREHAMELLDFVGISDLAEEQAKHLSFGQKKLMEFASVLMSEPKLIMLDEPAGGVNPALLESIVERIEGLNRQGQTFLIVEHNMDVVMNLSDYVIVMAHGQVLTQNTAEKVQQDPTVLEAYLGEA